MAFKRAYRLDALYSPDKVQAIFAEVYALCRDEVINLKDLSNVVPRLKTYVDDSVPAAPSAPASNALELKPNFMGVGINLNYLIERWLSRRKR